MARIKYIQAGADGNRTFIEDYVGIGNTIKQILRCWPAKRGSFTIFNGRYTTANTFEIPENGALLMRGKLFGLDNGVSVLTVPKGSYLYAIGEYDTTQPRVNSAGVTYYQNVVYYLRVSPTAESGTTNDYDALIGKWPIIIGAVTALMNNAQYEAYCNALMEFTPWMSMPPIPDFSITSDMLQLESVTNDVIAPGAVSPNSLASYMFPGTYNVIPIDRIVSGPTIVRTWSYISDIFGRGAPVTIDLREVYSVSDIGGVIIVEARNDSVNALDFSFIQSMTKTTTISVPAESAFLIICTLTAIETTGVNYGRFNICCLNMPVYAY